MTTGQDAEREGTERASTTPIETPIVTSGETPNETTTQTRTYGTQNGTPAAATTRDDRLDTATVPLSAPPRRSIRYAGVVWGVILCIVSGVTLYVLSERDRAAGVAHWLADLNGASLTALTALTIGVVVLVLVVLSTLRHAQRIR
jgi:hypothetical protein